MICADTRRDVRRAMSKKWRSTKMLRVLLAATAALRTIASAQPTSARSIFNKSIFVKTGAWEVCPRLKRYLLQAGEAQETRPMRTFLARLVVLAAACGWADSAYCDPFVFFSGFYSIQADAFDGSFPGIPNSGHVREQQQLDFKKTGGSS